MQRIELICFGKLRESFWRDAVAEYTKRLSAYCKLTVMELAEEPLPMKPSQKEIEKALEAEAEAALKYINRGKSYVFALCVEGKQMPSEAFAQRLEQIATMGEGDVVFLIGSSYGLSPRLKALADARISFSQMTFPHQMMRVILTEQLYRAYTIIEGKTYHK